ncbi:MAG: FG-GAP-like repeat-containing protein [Reichenbachiella sp.]|uniref:FG-GAP-like repeat-containing protein n=1 Tax=Reichenbachiella sp. TaxID=2184521 RepID=UPI003299FCCF
MKRKIIFTILIVSFISLAHAQFHLDINNTESISTQAGAGTAAWADIDGDGDMDVAFGPLDNLYLKFFINNEGSFEVQSSAVHSSNGGNIDFADFDGDGDLDMLVTRSKSAGVDNFYLSLYENNNGAFSLVPDGAGLPGTESHYGKWGDYDGDGDPDVAVIVNKSGTIRGVIYQNNDGVFTDIGTSLPESIDGSVDWADFDNDGDLDLLITGNAPGTTGTHSTIFQNNEGVFEKYDAELTGVMYSTGVWGDYDADGDPDLIISGSKLSLDDWPFGMTSSTVYRNDDGVFNNISAEIDGLMFGSADWGDMDDDGDLDLLLAGAPQYEPEPPSFEEKPFVAKIYLNNDGVFEDLGAELPGIIFGQALWSNYNGDDVLDFILFGDEQDDSSEGIAQFYTTYIAEDPIFIRDEEASSLFENVFFSNATWADYDDDLDMDLLLTGETDTNPISYIYENLGGTFVKTALEILGINGGTAEWGTFTEGRRDILLAGQHNNAAFIEVFSYNGLDGYVAKNANLKQLGYNGSGRASWADIDNDDDLDILINGYDNFFEDHLREETKLYLDHGGEYLEVETDIVPLADGVMSWGDYDQDGDMDLVVSGDGDQAELLVHKIYTNEAGLFVENPSILLEVFANSEAWGDYDGDGDLDLLFNGSDLEWNYHTRIYENKDGTFSDINAGLIGSAAGSVDWGDYDDDGDLDILITGEEADLQYHTRIYQNNEGVFTEIPTNFPGVIFGMARWVNIDSDRDLDIFITGFSDEGLVSELWINVLENNQPPVNLSLSNNTLNQSVGSMALVGTFTASDPDSDNALTYSLITGSSENSNEYFTIDQNNLYVVSSFEMFPGEYTIRVLVTDKSGGKLVNEFTIYITDNIAPVPVVHNNPTFYLNENGALNIGAMDLDEGSYDPYNNQEVLVAIDRTSFSCVDLGENFVDFTVTDKSENKTVSKVSLIVLDTISPTLSSRDITLFLDADGRALLSPTDVDNGSTDNCGIDSRTLGQTLFSCSDLGENLIEYSVSDESGNEVRTTISITLDTFDENCGEKVLSVESNIPLHIYPNPVAQQLTFSTPSPLVQGDEIWIIDLSGKTVLSSPLSTETQRVDLSVSELGRGWHLLVVKSGNQQIKKPFFKK